MKKRKKVTIVTVSIIFMLGFFMPYKYDKEEAVKYLENMSGEKSRCMCAWYVMKALQHGGCYPCGIYPAYAYGNRLLSMGFDEIPHDKYVPQIGDISVLSRNSRSSFGHIAVYNGQRWLSDFKQKSMYPTETYRQESEVRIFRQANGWHLANIWITPIHLVEYTVTLIKGHKKIRT